MCDSLRFAREIAKRCFRVNEEVDGKEYIAVFDTKLCAQMVEEKFISVVQYKNKICRTKCKE